MQKGEAWGGHWGLTICVPHTPRCLLTARGEDCQGRGLNGRGVKTLTVQQLCGAEGCGRCVSGGSSRWQ